MARMHYHIDMEEFAQLWSEGVTASELAARYCVSQTQVWRLRAQYGIPDRPLPQDHVPPDTAEEMRAAESLALSPWVQARIQELRIGFPEATR